MCGHSARVLRIKELSATPLPHTHGQSVLIIILLTMAQGGHNYVSSSQMRELWFREVTGCFSLGSRKTDRSSGLPDAEARASGVP